MVLFEGSTPHTRVRLGLAAIIFPILLARSRCWNAASSAQQPLVHKPPAKGKEEGCAPGLRPPAVPRRLPPWSKCRHCLRRSGTAVGSSHDRRGGNRRLRHSSSRADADRSGRGSSTECDGTGCNSSGAGSGAEISLAALLNGTHFNYVMMGSTAHPDSVERLILTSKSGGTAAPGLAAAPAEGNNEVQMDDPGTPGAEIFPNSQKNPSETLPTKKPLGPQLVSSR